MDIKSSIEVSFKRNLSAVQHSNQETWPIIPYIQ